MYWISAAATLIIGLVFPLTATAYLIDGSLLKVPLYLYSGTYYTLSIGAVTAYTMGIQFRLITINTVLQDKLDDKRGNIMKAIKSSQENASLYRCLAEAYQVLMDVCDDTNICYGFQMMIAFALILFYSLFTSFTAYADLADTGYITPVTWSSIAFALYYNFFSAVVLLTCSLASSQVSTDLFLFQEWKTLITIVN